MTRNNSTGNSLLQQFAFLLNCPWCCSLVGVTLILAALVMASPSSSTTSLVSELVAFVQQLNELLDDDDATKNDDETMRMIVNFIRDKTTTSTESVQLAMDAFGSEELLAAVSGKKELLKSVFTAVRRGETVAPAKASAATPAAAVASPATPAIPTATAHAAVVPVAAIPPLFPPMAHFYMMAAQNRMMRQLIAQQHSVVDASGTPLGNSTTSPGAATGALKEGNETMAADPETETYRTNWTLVLGDIPATTFENNKQPKGKKFTQYMIAHKRDVMCSCVFEKLDKILK
jgi:hypothetical protein